MNKSLKFLAIGLALAVLLVSQVGVDRTAEAVVIQGNNDTVEFAGEAGTSDAAEQQDFYRPGVTVDFYLKDPDLALPTANRTAEIVFTIPARSTVTGGNGFALRLPPAVLKSTGEPSGAYAPRIGVLDTATTTAEAGFGAGEVQGEADVNNLDPTFTANDHWKATWVISPRLWTARPWSRLGMR